MKFFTLKSLSLVTIVVLVLLLVTVVAVSWIRNDSNEAYIIKLQDRIEQLESSK